MAAQILETVEESLDPKEQTSVDDNETTDLFATETQQGQPQDQVDVDPDLPEKYQGKSKSEIIKMHQEAERLSSRQGNEVGELRKIVDDFIVQQTDSNQSTTEGTDVPDGNDDLDFFEDPKAAVQKAIESNKDIKALKETHVKSAKEQATQAIQKAVPNIKSHLEDQKFIEWVKASQIRMELLSRTDQYDVNAAQELFSMWETVSPASVGVDAEQPSVPNDRKEQLAKANTGSAKGSASSVPKKVFRRVDVMKLMNEDPKRYEAMSEEILKAYSEGRVR